MGQSSSRARRPLQTPTTSNEEQSSAAFPASSSSSPVESPINRVRHTSDISGSRRSSVRKSILNLVKPSNIRSRVNSVASSPGDLRRTWRNSRRWSKAPINTTLPYDEAERSSSSSTVLPLAGPSTLDKGKQPEAQLPLEEEDEEEDSYHEAPEEPQPLPFNQSFTDIDEDSEPPCTDSEPTSFVNPPPELTSGSVLPVSTENPTLLSSEPMTTSATTTAPPATPRPHTVPLPPRQFPPPGTLVIVQGVVHTTDISRTAPQHEAPSQSASNHLDVPDETGRSQARNRLSALLRPRSTSRRSSTVFNETSASERGSPSPDTDGSRSLSEETVLTTPSIDERAGSSQEPQSSYPQEPAPTPPDNHPPSISSSSIDVLGTLLSVAAAATAASLLTGSSEPILSTGLAPSPSSPTSSSAPTSPISSAYPRAAPDVSAASRAERMRQAWGTIRERLGLRPSAHGAHPPQAEDANGQPTPTQEGTQPGPTDARELMLAEMARAFNIGLGLNGINGETTSAPGAQADSEAVGGSNATQNSDASESTPERVVPSPSAADQPTSPTPPEGSFERFLVDLQIDLRNALTHVQDADPQSEQEAQAQSSEPEPSHSAESSESAESSSSQPTGPSSPRAASLIGRSQDSGPSLAQSTTPLPETSADIDTDTRSEQTFEDFDDEHDDGFDDDDFHSADHGSARTDQQQGSNHSNDQGGPSSSGMGRIDAAGRINWWRLYRFPAITSSPVDLASRPRQPNPQSTGSAASPTQNPIIPETPPTTLPNESSRPPMPTSEASSSTLTPASASEPPNSPSTPTSSIRSVVPVIIVGLQSVNAQWRPDVPMQPENEAVDILGQPGENSRPETAGIEPGDEADLEGWGTGLGAAEGGARGGGRSRGWQSRAADALRNLRPGRRNVEAGADGSHISPGSNGSRTFLIYVIGGYYPPDHNIVTGGPANFDSFEALLELADLLGQVKPPTVSKDDIANSGLEIVKASQLTKLFDDGKVTANCLDRCLICLEDYETEDDLRLMKCRHAFHQQCVDHWMQTGRNNCPACRTTGVSTEPRSPEPVPT